MVKWPPSLRVLDKKRKKAWRKDTPHEGSIDIASFSAGSTTRDEMRIRDFVDYLYVATGSCLLKQITS
jgi:hypothetical protein